MSEIQTRHAQSTWLKAIADPIESQTLAAETSETLRRRISIYQHQQVRAQRDRTAARDLASVLPRERSTTGKNY